MRIDTNYVSNKGITNKKANVSFKSGLPYSFARYVDGISVDKVTSNLAKEGIIADFKGCKPVAACVEKVVEIFKAYGKPLPKIIDFTPIEKENVPGQCKLVSQKVEINSNDKYFYDIFSLDKHADTQEGYWASTHFLGIFIHEFAHNIHFQNLLKKWGFDEAFSRSLALDNIQIRPFWAKNINGKYSEEDVSEYLAESITKRIANNLDENLDFKNTPHLGFVKRAETSFRNPFPNGAPLPENGFIWDKGIMESIQNTESAIWDGDIEFIIQHGFGIKGLSPLPEIKAAINTVKSVWNMF